MRNAPNRGHHFHSSDDDPIYHPPPTESFSSASFTNHTDHHNRDDGFGTMTTPAFPQIVPGVGSYQSFGQYHSGGNMSMFGTNGDRSRTGDPIFDSRSSVASGEMDETGAATTTTSNYHPSLYESKSFASSEQYSKHFVSANSMSPKKVSSISATKQHTNNRSTIKESTDDDDDDCIIPIPPPPKVVRSNLKSPLNPPKNGPTGQSPMPMRSFDAAHPSNDGATVKQPTYPLSPNYRNAEIGSQPSSFPHVAAPPPLQHSSVPVKSGFELHKRRPHTTTNAKSNKVTNDFRTETFQPIVSVPAKRSQKKPTNRHSVTPTTATSTREKNVAKLRPKTPPLLRLGRSKTPEQRRAHKSKSPARSSRPAPQEQGNHHRFTILPIGSFQNSTTRKSQRSKTPNQVHSSLSVGSNHSSVRPSSEIKSKSTSDSSRNKSRSNLRSPHASSTTATVVSVEPKRPSQRHKTPEKPRSKTPERLRNMMKIRSHPAANSKNNKSTVPDIVIPDSASIVSTMTKTTNVPSSEKSTTKKGFFRKLFGGRGGGGKGKMETIPDAEQPLDLLSDETISETMDIVPMVQPSESEHSIPANDAESIIVTQDLKSNKKAEEVVPVTNQGSDQDTPEMSICAPPIADNAAHVMMHFDHSHIPAVQDDRPEMFYSNDDISTLTVPTIEAPSSFGIVPNTSSFGSSIRSNRPRRRGDDPSVRSGHSSDPMGKYWQNNPIITKIVESPSEKSTPVHDNATKAMTNMKFPSIDSNQNAFFVEPDGTTPSVTPTTVKVEPKASFVNANANVDPVGNSPFASTRYRRRPKVVTDQDDGSQLFASPKKFHDPSPQGIQSFAAFTSETDALPTLRDPIGESPMHQNGRVPSALRDGSPVAPDPPLYLKVLHLDDSDIYIPDNEDSVNGNVVSFPTESKTIDDAFSPTNKALLGIKLGTIENTIETTSSTPLSVAAERTNLKAGHQPLENRPLIQENKSLSSFRVPRNRPLNVKIQESKPTESLSTPVTDVTPRANNVLQAASTQTMQPKSRDTAAVPITSPRIGVLMQKVIAKSPRYKTKPSPNNSMLSISPSMSDSSSFFSETMATRKAKQRLTMSKAARVNAKAVALLHSLHGQPSPRNCWQDADAESVATSTTAITEFLHGGTINIALQSNNTTATVQKSSLLFSSLRKGKFKDRKIETSSKVKASVPNESDNESIEMTKVETAVSQLQSKLNVHLGISPARSRSTPKASRSKLINLYADDHDASFVWGKQFPKTDDTNEVQKGDYLVDINECFPEFTPTNKESINESFQFPELQNTSTMSTQHVFSGQRNTAISKFAVLKGYEILRNQREYEIVTGKSLRVLPTPALRAPAATTKSTDYEALDPIQRAGRRLLSKAAVPIQAAARRYLAQLEAVDRMWALIEIQSYLRRWRAETALISSRHSAITIQAVARGYITVKRQLLMIDSVIKIQKMIRGYIVAAKTYDLIYSIVLVQAEVRGWLTRFRIRRHLAQVKAAAELEAARKLQTWWRSQSARMLYEFLRYDTVVAQCAVRRHLAKRRTSVLRQQRQIKSAIKIQAVWRGIQAYSAFIFYLVDIMLIQRSVRCWIAKRDVQQRRMMRSSVQIQSAWRRYVVYHSYSQFKAVLLLQAVFRGYTIRVQNKRHRAATTIQTEWRCFSAYTDYIFVLADIIRIQNATRRWLTKREVASRKMKFAAVILQSKWRAYDAFSSYKATVQRILKIQCVARSHIAKNVLYETKMERSAITIQKSFRRFSARQSLLHDFVQVILIQSLVRRFVARSLVRRMRIHNDMVKSNEAATLIQSAWRGFWQYSHYVILQYEVVRIQSVIRGKLFRNDFNLQLGCSIMIQAAVRRFLAMKKVHRLKVTEVWTGGQVQGIIDVQACRRIQFWWRVVLECRREKNAALIIERFFLMIKREIENEIVRREKSKLEKRKKRHREKREDDDKLLERAWLNTVDSATDIFSFASDNASDVFDFSPKHKSKSLLSPTAQSSTLPTSADSSYHKLSIATSTKNGVVLPSPVDVVKKPVGKADKMFGEAATKKSSSSKTDHHTNSRSLQASKRHESISHRASSPPKDLIMRHEYDLSPTTGNTKTRRPATTRSYRTGTMDNERSAISPLRRAKALTRKKSIDLAENLSLEEAYLDASIQQEKERRKQSKTAPNRESLNSRFFADDLESIDDGCNFLDEFTEAAEALTDLGRARTKQITSELTTAINQTRLTIKGATDAISSRTSTASSSLLFGNDLSQLTINEKPEVVFVDPLKISTSRTPTSSRRSNRTTPKSSTHSSIDHGEFISPRKNKSGTTPKTMTVSHDEDYSSPRKNRTGKTPKSTRHSKELYADIGVGDGSQLHSAMNNNNTTTTTNTKSPRHGKLQVMHPLKEYPKRLISLEDENQNEYDGGDFGMI